MPGDGLHGVNVYYFWGDGCPVCAQQRVFLDWLVENYPEVEVHDFEVYYEIPNRELLEALSEAFGEPVRAVPVTFIGEQAWIGFSQTIATQMLASIERYLTYEAPDAADLIEAELRERFLPEELEEEEQP